MKQHISVSESAFRLRLSYRKTLDWLFSGKLRGRRHGKHWEVELAGVQALERELGLVQDDLDRAG